MDAVKFEKVKYRMCKSFSACGECPAYKKCTIDHIEELVDIVEKWDKEKPKLLPCPFCNSQPVHCQSNGMYYVRCSNSNCLVFPATLYRNSLEEAVEAWNRRADVSSSNS